MKEHNEPKKVARALMTDREKELISGRDPDASDARRYQAISRVRNKIQHRLPEDIDILEEDHPQLLEEIREVVCEYEEGRDR